jgi:hypothetical protein
MNGKAFSFRADIPSLQIYPMAVPIKAFIRVSLDELSEWFQSLRKNEWIAGFHDYCIISIL